MKCRLAIKNVELFKWLKDITASKSSSSKKAARERVSCIGQSVSERITAKQNKSGVWAAWP